MNNPCVYLDNAATSWPKPPAVARAMAEFLEHSAGNPGRGGHLLARRACAVVEQARTSLASLVGCTDTRRMVLTHGCTDSVNIAIHGTLGARMRCDPDTKPGVVISSIEHNAVLRTACCYANEGHIELTIVNCDRHGRVDPQEILRACTECTALVCLSHASNALGTIQDVAAVGATLKDVAPHALFLVDAAQTVGHLEFSVEDAGIDLLSIAGHKGLLGPTGTGGLYVGPRAYPDHPDAPKLFCIRRGGTGIAAPGTEMPTQLPDALEAGTANAVGFAGLIAGINARSPDAEHTEQRLTARIIEGLDNIDRVTRYGLDASHPRTAVVLFNIEGLHPREAAAILDQQHGIAVRGGTHCAPMAHEAIGTGEAGAVRASPGPMTTDEEVDTLLRAVAQIAAARAAV